MRLIAKTAWPTARTAHRPAPYRTVTKQADERGEHSFHGIRHRYVAVVKKANARGVDTGCNQGRRSRHVERAGQLVAKHDARQGARQIDENKAAIDVMDQPVHRPAERAEAHVSRRVRTYWYRPPCNKRNYRSSTARANNREGGQPARPPAEARRSRSPLRLMVHLGDVIVASASTSILVRRKQSMASAGVPDNRLVFVEARVEHDARAGDPLEGFDQPGITGGWTGARSAPGPCGPRDPPRGATW